MEQFKNKDWKIRKKGGDDVEAILREAKMRIEPNGLNELMENIKNLMLDSSNKDRILHGELPNERSY